LYIEKRRPYRPTRVWTKIGEPGDEKQIRTAATARTGANKHRPADAMQTSVRRFAARQFAGTTGCCNLLESACFARPADLIVVAGRISARIEGFASRSCIRASQVRGRKGVVLRSLARSAGLMHRSEEAQTRRSLSTRDRCHSAPMRSSPAKARVPSLLPSHDRCFMA
jgi:hypothetical protein